jgi:hypothetical protein
MSERASNREIDADKGLRLRSGIKLVFAPGAVLKALPSAREKYSILNASDVSDVENLRSRHSPGRAQR